jgi:hypothetical protein
MKRFKLLAIASVAVALFCLAFPLTVNASADQENGVTLPQYLIGAFVMGWYLVNHFKERIKTLSKKLFSKHSEAERVED